MSQQTGISSKEFRQRIPTEEASEMHSAKKGNRWRFGMKCHIGVDAGSGLVHTVVTTSANVQDVTVASKLIREDNEVIYRDPGYLCNKKRPEAANDEHLSTIDYRINLRPGRFPKVSDNAIDWNRYIERLRSSVRCKVEHIFRVIKYQFGCKKVRYRGLKKCESALCYVGSDQLLFYGNRYNFNSLP